MGDQLMDINTEVSLAAQYSYRDKFYPAYLGRASRALIPKARAALPKAQISLQSGETQ